jgi:hypothetical protein
MQFMLIVKRSESTGCGCERDEDLVAAVAGYTQTLRKAGALVELSKLHPSSKAASVKLLGQDRIVTDGPFAETKELVGGYWIIEAGSLNEAVEWAKRVPAPAELACEIEVRQFLEVENFFPEKPVDGASETFGEIAKAKKQSE